MFLIFILVGFTVVFCSYYLIGKYNEDYWKRRGVVFYTKNKVLGPMWEFLYSDKAMFELFHEVLYKKYPNEPAVGFGSFMKPALYLRDPRNIEYVLQSGFSSFYHRGSEIYEKDVLADNVLFMNGDRWKLTRQVMTPLFTTGKLKNMFYIIDKSAKDFVDYLKNDHLVEKTDMFNTISTFCCAAVGATVFGIETKSVFDSPFLAMATQSFAITTIRSLKFFLQRNILSNALKIFKLKLFPEYKDFFVRAIKLVIRKREHERNKKHDFVDLCVSLQKKGMLRDSDTGYELKPTDELLAAQGFFFFVAGVEPTSIAIFTACVELGRKPEILQKLHDEIDKVWEKCNGELSYEVVAELEYLDKVLNEVLRMYPPIGFMTRKCVQDAVLPAGNIKVEKGCMIYIPIFELHHDPNHYPSPEVFNPERSSLANNNITYLPFGRGKRKCIGLRYSLIQVKTIMFHLLREFSPKTKVMDGGIKFSKHLMLLRITNVHMELLPR